MSEERRPLYITETELNMIAHTPIFEYILSWDSLEHTPKEWRPWCMVRNPNNMCSGMVNYSKPTLPAVMNACVKCPFREVTENG